MAAVAVLLIALGVGIFVGVKSKKLTATELIVCGSFGLLLGGTEPGRWLHDLLVKWGNAAVPVIANWLQ